MFATLPFLALLAINQGVPSGWLPGTAFAIPKETAPEGEGYFAIVEGNNRRLYIGTHANAINSWLVEFNTLNSKMDLVVDVHKAIGKDIKGFGSQAKIHSRNWVGASGKIYFASKQGYPDKNEKRSDYPGGYPMVYDPASKTTRVYPIPIKHHGIISFVADEERGLGYVSTCSDNRPDDNTHFLVLDLKTGKYTDLGDMLHCYAFIVIDHLGRAYHPVKGGDIARYDPGTKKLERLKQTIGGKPPSKDSHLADENGHPINWDITPDGKTLYSLPMSSNRLYAYDLTQTGKTLEGTDLGELIPGAKGSDCRGMCVGPGGTVWASVTAQVDGYNQNHVVRCLPGGKPQDLGKVAFRNPDYTPMTGADGKTLPGHHGIQKTKDGATTSKWVTMGICQAKDGAVYMLIIQPYTLVRVEAKDLK
ncbi:MAG: hypothetical protein EXR99_16395 [Gemmataceae bacterium]|nr:hypothetical protein [Gemmataceae bacterium]